MTFKEKIKIICFISLWMFLKGVVNAQSQSYKTLIFYPSFGDTILSNHAYYRINTTDSIQISEFKFYVSGIELINKKTSVWKESHSFHLIDVSNDLTRSILLNLPAFTEFDQLKFNLGIDSLTNVSGALGGDLDPVYGMYWSWQSGYINLKIEGTSNLCQTRNHQFQFHLGGYQHPFNAVRTILLNVDSKKNPGVVIDMKKFMEAINLAELNHVMSPRPESLDLTEKFLKALYVR